MGNSPNHINFIDLHKTAFQELAHIFQYCGYTSWCAVSRRHTGNPRFSTCPRQRHFAAIVHELYPGLAPLSLAEKDQEYVSFVSHYKRGMRQARLSSTRQEHPAQVILYAWIENLSSGTDKLLLLSPLNIHSILLSRSCLRKCCIIQCILPTAVSGCFRLLLFWSGTAAMRQNIWRICASKSWLCDGTQCGIFSSCQWRDFYWRGQLVDHYCLQMCVYACSEHGTSPTASTSGRSSTLCTGRLQRACASYEQLIAMLVMATWHRSGMDTCHYLA